MIINHPWTGRVKLLLVVFFSLHLFLSVVYLDNIVWRINYASIRLISEGQPMYEQKTYLEGSQSIWLPPKHFPVYFYTMAFFAKLGAGQIGIRIITWFTLFPLLYFLIKLTDIRNETMMILFLILFFLDPILIETNFIGKFDQFAIMFMLAGLYMVKLEKPFLAGILIAIGTLSKFQPFFAFLAVAVVYTKKQSWKQLMLISASCLGTILSSLLYLYWKYGDGFTQVVKFQSSRKTPNLSMWYYLIPNQFSTDTILALQLLFYGLIGMISLFLVSEKLDHSILLLTSFFNAAFVLGSSQYYSTYSYFFTLPFLPILIEFVYTERYKEIIIFLFSITFYFVGLLFCFNSCYPTINPFTMLSAIGIILISISTFAFTFCFGYISLLNKRNNLIDPLIAE